MTGHARPFLPLLACLWLAGVSLAAGDADEAGPNLPPGLEIDFEGTLSQTKDGGVEFTGPVTLSWKGNRIQADRLALRERRFIEAEGNVLLVWGKNRIFGSRARYDLEEETGIIEEAMGQVLDEYIFWADWVKKVGEDKLHLRHAVVTTCTQPLPYWSFAVSSARITIEKYARMRNVRLRGGHVPTLYLPYLVWPVKEGRAAGLLMPEFNSTSTRGRAITQQLFIPLGRSADVTLLGRYYTEAGFGGGGDLRFIPNLNGEGSFSGFYIDDKVSQMERYRAKYGQTQQFLNGFRMVADIEVVSDPNYYGDFERDLNTTSSPQTVARLEFARNGPWASMNVRELRREQLSTGLVQQTLPEVEWRGRSRQLWGSPFYLAFQSSLASIQQRGGSIDADYLRGDLQPDLTVPWSPWPWLDVTPRVGYRWTYYSQQQPVSEMDVQAEDDSLLRQLLTYDLEIVGPKLFRIFDSGESGGRYKHTIEPQVRYGFSEAFDRADEVLLFDEVDSVSGAGKEMSYALVQRLFAKRPRSLPAPRPVSTDSVVLPDGTVHDASTPAAEADSAEDAPAVPVEIASLQIGQRRSFEDSLSFADLDGDGMNEATSKASPVSLTGRFNPGPAVSIDVRGSYDILYDAIRDASVSGALRGRLASMRFSVYHRAGLGVQLEGTDLVPVEDSTQVRVTAGVNLLQERLQLKMDASYTADPEPGQDHVPDQRWQLLYSTECCTIMVERLTRAFATPEDRRELHFRIDLRGVGKLLSQTF
jgi:LPS-assembly protein